jgi:dienelactone hydrolase
VKQFSSIRVFADSFTSDEQVIPVERFEPEDGGRHPALLLLHGADGLQYRGDSYRAMAQEFARHGYAVFLVHYLGRTRTAYGGLYGNPLQSLTWLWIVRDAVSHAVLQASVDPQRIGVVGISLGAYLATSLGMHDPRIGAVVDCFGGLPEPLAHGLTHMPPVLILHGAADPVVPVREAYRLERLLRDKGLPQALIHI